MKLIPYLELEKIFSDNGYKLFTVGGTTRDFLLNRNFDDFDLVSDATPEQIKEFLPNADFSFSKFGCVRIKQENFKIDITTLRIEGDYLDFRHPSFVKYVKNIDEDYKRRDFTINALYMDKDGKVYDFCGGKTDLNNKLIKFIGDPETRIKEDPLRILRAKRFAKTLGFEIEKNTLMAIQKLEYLLSKLNPQKVEEELSKIK